MIQLIFTLLIKCKLYNFSFLPNETVKACIVCSCYTPFNLGKIPMEGKFVRPGAKFIITVDIKEPFQYSPTSFNFYA